MQIQLIKTSEGLSEWMAVELHGIITPQETDSKLDEKNLGTICWANGNSPFIIIGSQTLEGKIMKIDRPVLVVRKHDEYRMDGKKIAQVNAVIRKKLVFKVRPRPLVISTVT